MAFNAAPTSLFTGYTDTGTAMTIPHTALGANFDAADADAATGDWRAIMLALFHTLSNHWQGLADADRPSGFVVGSVSQTQQTTGDFAGKWRIEYRFTVYADLPLPNIADEPV